MARSSEEAKMPGKREHKQDRVLRFRLARRANRLVACSVCLRVLDDGAWVEADHAIRHLRTFEHENVVRLGRALCDRCEMELRIRRQSAVDSLAA